MRCALSGARLISFEIPRLERSTAKSSNISPIAIMKATSPAAKTSSINIHAVIAIEIKSGEDIFLPIKERLSDQVEIIKVDKTKKKKVTKNDNSKKRNTRKTR